MDDIDNNPYKPPSVFDDTSKDIVLPGGWLSIKNTKPMHCYKAWLSFENETLRVCYEPKKNRLFVASIIALIIVVWAQVLILLMLLYVIIDMILQLISRKMIEFELNEESWFIDKESSFIGVRKFKKGYPIFIGTRIPQEHLEQIEQKYKCREMPIKQKSLLKSRLIIIAIWIIAFYLGIQLRIIVL